MPVKKLKIKCPVCERTCLECVQNGIHSSEILEIREDGDFEYGDITSDTEYVERFQCMYCGYVIKNDKGVITENHTLVEYLRRKQ
mgnify:CR=1 FL=1